MKKAHWMLFALSLGLGACGDAGSQTEPVENEDNSELGNLSLNLTGLDTSARTYRLRQATFEIWGYPDYPINADGGSSVYSNTVTTETDPDAPVINLRVVPGYYQVYLSNADWYLERRSGNTDWERVEQAVLLSSTSQSAYVYNQGISPVNFRFGVDGELIDFRAGDLPIGIEIEQPGDGPGDAGFPPGFPGGLFGGLGGLTGGGIVGGGIVGGVAGGVGGGSTGGVEVDAGSSVP